MKNVHLIPTGEEFNYERSFIMSCVKEFSMFGKDYKLGDFLEEPAYEADREYWQPNLIYITSDEKIKEGDWCHARESNPEDEDDIRDFIYKNEKDNRNTSTEKKIVLTNDTKLIADGISEITAEFLQWYVTNHDCDFVEVFKVAVNCSCDDQNTRRCKLNLINETDTCPERNSCDVMYKVVIM